MVFIAVLLSLERAAQMINKKPAPLAERGKKKTTPSLCVIHKDRIGKIRFCGATLLALLISQIGNGKSPSTESQHSPAL